MKTLLRILILVLLLGSCDQGINIQPVTPKPDTGKEDPEPSEGKEPWQDATGVTGGVYINNGEIQLGVDPARGGTIFHFSESETKRNLVNHYDEGREIQQSYYGWADGSSWNGQSWVWNPVQGGSASGVKGKIIEQEVKGTSIYIKSTPVLWASGDYANDCIMEETITLEDRVAHVKFSFKYNGTKTGTARHQELPAFFVDWGLQNFVWYDGTKPWTNAAISSYVPDRLDLTNKNEYKTLSESWAAYVNDEGWGIGIYSPAATQCTLYRFGSGPDGPMSAACSYLAPIATLQITPGWTFHYDVYFTIGSKEEIRQRFYSIHNSK